VKRDIVLSIGSGFNQTELRHSEARHWLWDKSLFRLIRSFKTQYNGKKNWEDHWNGLDAQDRESSFRVDVPLNDDFELDQAEKIDSLQAASRKYLEQVSFDHLRTALVAASFFFELESPPSFNGILYECQGAFLCRSPNRLLTIRKLVQDFPEASFYVDSTLSLGKVADGYLCQICGMYRKSVKLWVHHPSQSLHFNLRFNGLYRKGIAGFPSSVSCNAERLGFGNAFGFQDHRNNARINFSCGCEKRAKRKWPFEPEQTLKKRTKLSSG
jgi:hypothetical protein